MRTHTHRHMKVRHFGGVFFQPPLVQCKTQVKSPIHWKITQVQLPILWKTAVKSLIPGSCSHPRYSNAWGYGTSNWKHRKRYYVICCLCWVFCLSLSLPVCLKSCPPVCLSACLSLCLPMCVSVCMRAWVHELGRTCMCVCLCVLALVFAYVFLVYVSISCSVCSGLPVMWAQHMKLFIYTL